MAGGRGDMRERWAVRNFFVCRVQVDCQLRASFSEKRPRLSYFIRGAIYRKPKKKLCKCGMDQEDGRWDEGRWTMDGEERSN
eukprot:scaffold21539_cov48-Cyclotella_meneghiniana.AAC.2